MSKLFNENMTSVEARYAFFAATDGKTKEEIDEIRKEYKPIAERILQKELELADHGYLL